MPTKSWVTQDPECWTGPYVSPANAGGQFRWGFAVMHGALVAGAIWSAQACLRFSSGRLACRAGDAASMSPSVTLGEEESSPGPPAADHPLQRGIEDPELRRSRSVSPANAGGQCRET